MDILFSARYNIAGNEQYVGTIKSSKLKEKITSYLIVWSNDFIISYIKYMNSFILLSQLSAL